MQFNQHKKAATQLRGLKFVFALFGVVFMILMFYIWVQKNITAQAKTQAEITSSEIELRIFFSELIRKHGIEIAKEEPGKTAEIIAGFAKKHANIDKGGYTASCSKKGTDKECTLTITLHDVLGAIVDWTLFASGAALIPSLPIAIVATPLLVALKQVVVGNLKEVFHETYLPLYPNQATHFKLNILVKVI